MEPKEAYEQIKKIYQKAQVEIDRLAKEHQQRVEDVLEEADRKKIEDVRARIDKL